jgi:hypothetical protein
MDAKLNTTKTSGIVATFIKVSNFKLAMGGL